MPKNGFSCRVATHREGASSPREGRGTTHHAPGSAQLFARFLLIQVNTPGTRVRQSPSVPRDSDGAVEGARGDSVIACSEPLTAAMAVPGSGL